MDLIRKCILGGLYLFVINLKYVLTLELEYTKVVKQTFGVPGAPGNAMVGVSSPTLGHDLLKDAKMAKEDELSHTAFVLTVMVVSTIGILLFLVLMYFCCSCLLSLIGCIRKMNERRKRSRQMIKVDSLTSSSSLESV